MIFLARVTKLACLSLRVWLVVGVEATGTDSGEDDGGDEGILMTLVGGQTTGVDVDEIRLCHCKGSCGMVAVGETGATVGEGIVVVAGGED